VTAGGRAVMIEADEEQLAGAWFGDRTEGAPEIVLLHEGLGSISMWTDFPDALAKATGAAVFAYDRQGHGLSGRPRLPRPKEWMHHEALTVLPVVLSDQEIEKPLLFSHSDGATIALIHAAHHPVRGVVSEAAHVFQDDMMVSGAQRATGQWAHGVLRKFLTEHHGDNAEMLLTGWLDWWRHARRRDWHILADLARITCPVLAIQGTEDPYGTPEQVTKICAAVAGPAQEIFLDTVGHIPHHEVRDRILRETLDWIAQYAILES